MGEGLNRRLARLLQPGLGATGGLVVGIEALGVLGKRLPASSEVSAFIPQPVVGVGFGAAGGGGNNLLELAVKVGAIGVLRGDSWEELEDKLGIAGKT